MDLVSTASETTTISGVIADQAGSFGIVQQGLAGNVIIGDPTGRHTGVVLRSVDDTYAGATTIDSGTLALLNPNAAGSRIIQFGTAIGLVLQLGSGDVPTNQINGFAPGDTIDMQRIRVAVRVTTQADGALALTSSPARDIRPSSAAAHRRYTCSRAVRVAGAALFPTSIRPWTTSTCGTTR